MKNQEKKDNLNRPIMSKENESVIKNITTNKRPGEDGFNTESIKYFNANSLQTSHST